MIRHSELKKLAQRLYRPTILAGLAVVIGGLVAAPHVYRLANELANEPIYLVEGGEVRISRPHKWVNRDFFRQAIERGGLRNPLSVANPMLVTMLRAGLEGDPWIESVEQISVSLQDGVEVMVTYREPALMVQTIDGLFPVDVNGVVLPADDFSKEDRSSFPLLRVFAAERPTAVGKRWRDDRVLAAAQLARVLSPKNADASLWDRCELVEIRPSDSDETTFEITSREGSRVIWGRVDQAGQTVEPSDEQKLGKLERILASRGSLSAPAGPYLIDLRLWDQITLEPLAVSYR